MNDRTARIMKILAAIVVIILLGMVRLYAPHGNNVEAGAPVQEEIAGSDQTKQIKTQKTETDALRFRNDRLLQEHFDKHGNEMGFSSADEYERAASAAATNPNALHKTEKEDGDDVYYVESTNEFVIVSTDGYIRTYFLPDSGKRYFDKQ